LIAHEDLEGRLVAISGFIEIDGHQNLMMSNSAALRK